MSKKKPSAISEQRLYKRYDVEKLKMTAKLAMTKASVLDISSGGARIVLDKYLPIGKEFILKVHYYDTIIPVTAIVRWSKIFRLVKNSHGETAPTYLTGIEFKVPLEQRGIDIAEVVGMEIDIGIQ